MTDPRQPSAGWGNREGKGGGRELAAKAERHLAELTEPGRSDREPLEPGGPDAAASPGPEAWPPGGASGHASNQAEALELGRAAMAATQRLSRRVNAVGSKVDATSADLIELDRAMIEALEATNKRLEALELRLRPGSS